MKKETYEQQRVYAGEKKASMKRRCVGHDYTDRQMYMVTMVTEGREPWFGQVVGHAEALPGSAEAPRMELSPMGEAVRDCWLSIPAYHPEIDVVALQMMPDHLHGILFVREKMEKPLGKAILGFKQGCNKRFRELVLEPRASAAAVAPVAVAPVRSVAVVQQQTEPRGLLFAHGYNDRLLLRAGQLDRWRAYLRDNPRRLLVKREPPEYFRVQRNLQYAGLSFSAIGNRFLLDRPWKIQVQCSRRLTDEEIENRKREMLAAGAQGAVFVSPCISKGEKAIVHAVFDAGFPVVCLQENGLTELAKPGGRRFDACARGQMLILAPWEHHNERIVIARSQCLQLNEMARVVCEREA